MGALLYSSYRADASLILQADAIVSVRVQRSFLAAAKHGRTPSPQRRISPMVGKGSSPGAGLSMAYSASSEDGTSTSGNTAQPLRAYCMPEQDAPEMSI